MDGQRFDTLVQLLGSLRSRRATLGAMLGAVLGSTALDSIVAKRKAKNKGKGKGKGNTRGKGGNKGKRRRSQARAEAVPARCFTGSPCIPGPGKNLGKCNFGGSPALKNQNLTGANLGSANLAGGDASGANFTGANLDKACLVDANLTGATITGTTSIATAILCRTTMPDGTPNNAGCGKGTNCCPTCDAAHPCDDGQVCCNGRCRNGDCCINSDCPSNVCCGTTCCEAGQICISGECVLELILSGGPNPTTNIFVDDDLRVRLNGQDIFNESDGFANSHAPIAFLARPGDSLRITATNGVIPPPCVFLSPLYLHRAAGGPPQVLDAAGVPFPNPCNAPVGVFYDETFTIAL